MKACPFRLFSLALPVAFVSRSLGAPEDIFAPRPTGLASRLGDGIALFLLADLPVDRLPPSLCLLAPSRPAGALPATWAVAPAFSFSARRTRATIRLAEGTDGQTIAVRLTR